MTPLAERSQVMALLGEAMAGGARRDRACAVICRSERTVQRWQRDALRGDQRPLRVQLPGWPTRGSTWRRNRRFTGY